MTGCRQIAAQRTVSSVHCRPFRPFWRTVGSRYPRRTPTCGHSGVAGSSAGHAPANRGFATARPRALRRAPSGPALSPTGPPPQSTRTQTRDRQHCENPGTPGRTRHGSASRSSPAGAPAECPGVHAPASTTWGASKARSSPHNPQLPPPGDGCPPGEDFTHLGRRWLTLTAVNLPRRRPAGGPVHAYLLPGRVLRLAVGSCDNHCRTSTLPPSHQSTASACDHTSGCCAM